MKKIFFYLKADVKRLLALAAPSDENAKFTAENVCFTAFHYQQRDKYPI